MKNKENIMINCSECEYLKMYDIMYTCYYCDHGERKDEVGKLGVKHLPKTSPKWCPKRKQ